MPKRISKRTSDLNAIAFRVVKAATESARKEERSLLSDIMKEMGRKGGKISGSRRMENLTSEKRQEIASKAAKARWAKRSANN
jgi:general stress protein YciG